MNKIVAKRFNGPLVGKRSLMLKLAIDPNTGFQTSREIRQKKTVFLDTVRTATFTRVGTGTVLAAETLNTSRTSRIKYIYIYISSCFFLPIAERSASEVESLDC